MRRHNEVKMRLSRPVYRLLLYIVGHNWPSWHVHVAGHQCLAEPAAHEPPWPRLLSSAALHHLNAGCLNPHQLYRRWLLRASTSVPNSLAPCRLGQLIPQ